MNRHPTRSIVAALTLTAVLAVSAAASAAPLVGTFRLAPGSIKKRGTVLTATGTYFRMIYPKGNTRKGPFFKNSASRGSDKTYTPLRPGIDGGLRTGAFQPMPTPAFSPTGFSLANRIVRPESFVGIKFSLSTDPTDQQSSVKVATPSIQLSGRKLSGDLRAFTASWNSIYFNQGSPKPNGRRPGNTKPVTGTYNPKTKHFVLTWVSQIVSGPFNDFSGYWHLEGTFRPS
jgi:hypothetical protein